MMQTADPRHQSFPDGRVLFFDNCHLSVERAAWEFAVHNRERIAEHWHRRISENPRMFNGTVHVLVASNVANRTFVGKYARTDFASYLYWRESGFSDPASWDCFATVLIFGRQGRLLAAKAAPHTLNAGLFVAPGGMIDERDVGEDQNINVTSYAMREVFEETGLQRNEVSLDDGVWVARDGALIAMALVGRASCSDDELIERIVAHSAQSDDAEFAEVRWLDCDACEPAHPTPHYLKLLTSELCRRSRVG